MKQLSIVFVLAGLVFLVYGGYQLLDADDRTIIVPTALDEVLTLLTCYPFNYAGSAPDRYIITALPAEES